MRPILRDYGRELSWDVGALFAHDRYIHELIDICKSMGYQIPIKTVFGSIPCTFQGGRVAPRNATLPDALDILDEYAKRGIGCRLTFSSTKISEEDLDDTIANELMSRLNQNTEVKSGVLVCSDILAKYIKSTYPNLEVIASQVKPSIEVGLGPDKDTSSYYLNLLNIYDRVTVNPHKIEDGRFLSDIRPYADRVDFITNHKCVPDCPVAGRHYELYDEVSLKALRDEDPANGLDELAALEDNCKKIRSKYPTAGTSFSVEDIQMLSSMGFTNFRLEGRTCSGSCFVRDIGEYIFIPSIHSRIAQSIMGEGV
jgi:hypothetical protein